MNMKNTDFEGRLLDILSVTNNRAYVFVANMESDVSRWTKNAVEYFDLPGEVIENTNEVWINLVHPDDREKYLEAYNNMFSNGLSSQIFEYRARNKYGKYVLCTCKAIISRGKNGEPDLFAGTIINHDMYDIIDPTTNLHVEKEFAGALKEILKSNRPAVAVKVAITMFSHINVMYGYEKGNEILKQFGEKIKAIAGSQGRVYRLDGAKFAILVEKNLEEESIYKIYDEIKKIAQSEIYIKDYAVPLTLAGSAVILDGSMKTDEEVKSGLSYSLSKSKHEHHGELVIFSKDEGYGIKNIEMISAIHRSILSGCEGFYLKYQPLIDVKTGRVAGAEALLRWHSDEYGEVPPGMFIPWIEVDPAFYTLGNWVIDTALKEISPIKKKYKDFILNVNIAASQLERKEFREEVLCAIKKYDFPPQDFFMELTERCRELDSKFLTDEMAFFHSHGLKISLDDFGTGSSSLYMLRELPIDELKVDMSFIKNIISDKTNQSIVKAIVQCANSMQIKSCLEGVEDGDISHYLDQHGATYYQGYNYSKPVIICEFEDYVDNVEKSVCG